MTVYLKSFRWRLLLLVLASPAAMQADVVLAPLFRDHAVLQRDRAVPVWGWAAESEKVSVQFGDVRVVTTTEANGRWSVLLPAFAASWVPRELIVVGQNRLVVRDVLVGDVWLCSGQSNMQMAVRNALNPAREKTHADYPAIRHFKVPPSFSKTPQATVGGEWKRCSAETVEDFSAVAFFFARAVWQDVGVPIGLVNASYGNTPIASWRSAGSLGNEPAVAAWWHDQQKTSPFPRPHRPPAACYNGMIHPLIPYALRGILWYQGESDASEATTLAPVYARQFVGLVEAWRRDFASPGLPFFWVSLAGYGKAGDRAWVMVREAQTKALTLAGTGEAVAIDVGDPTDIHPKNKQAVGARLALLASRRVYGREIEDTGPTPLEIRALTATGGRGGLLVRFSHAAGGLLVRGELAPAFELAGADRRFHPATEVTLDREPGDLLVIRAAGVPAPVAVRYAWRAYPSAPLFNRAGLPAAPFRSDRW